MRKLALPIALVFGFAMIGCSDDDDNCVDVDGDGYGEGSDCMGPDCDDNDETVWMEMDGYGDVDEDGEAAETATTVCTDGTLPAEYSATAGTDCDDTNAEAVAMIEAYVDGDGDGYGEPTATTACGDDSVDPVYLPPGFVANGDDCDDASAMLLLNHTGYADNDGDGIAVDVESTICGTELAPAHLMTTDGTDCDDADIMAQDAVAHAPLCALKGFCLDTEPIYGLNVPDLHGVGACASTDCNGMDGACNAPMVDQGTTCVDDTDCNGGEMCKDFGAGAFTCWAVPNCCNNDPAGLTCNELVLDCMLPCNDLTDDAARIQCLQFDCVEQATPLAQQLYAVAQKCATDNLCFLEEDFVGCAMGLCNASFVMGCLADAPAP